MSMPRARNPMGTFPLVAKLRACGYNNRMRLFIASGFSRRVIERVKEMQLAAAPLFGGTVAWVPPENLHLTYVFLGNVAAQMAPAATKNVERTGVLFKKLQVRLSGLGAFPSLESPRVLWLGLIEARPGSLRTMAAKLSEALSEEGFLLDTNFQPHITIGRVKAPVDPAAVRELRRKAEELEAADVITSIEVIESRISHLGPKYRILTSTRLA